MSWDDELRTGLDEAADLLPIDQTVALAAAKSQGRKSVRRRRVLAASGGVLTASALLVGALSLVQDSSSESVVAGEPDTRSACDGAFPTASGLDHRRWEAIDDRTWTVDGHTLVIADAHRLNRQNAVEGRSRFVWITAGDTQREVARTLYSGPAITELGFAGTHLPQGCEVVLRLDASRSEGGRLVVEEFEAKLVWPASVEPQPIVVDDVSLVCGKVAPVVSAELGAKFGAPETTVGPDGQLIVRWADASGSVEVRHPAGPEAVETFRVPAYQDDAACDTAEIITTGVVSIAEARSVLRPTDPGLVDDNKRLGTQLETSSAFEVNTEAPPTTESSATD
jgi:hypothetical protein